MVFFEKLYCCLVIKDSVLSNCILIGNYIPFEFRKTLKKRILRFVSVICHYVWIQRRTRTKNDLIYKYLYCILYTIVHKLYIHIYFIYNVFYLTFDSNTAFSPGVSLLFFIASYWNIFSYSNDFKFERLSFSWERNSGSICRIFVASSRISFASLKV